MCVSGDNLFTLSSIGELFQFSVKKRYLVRDWSEDRNFEGEILLQVDCVGDYLFVLGEDNWLVQFSIKKQK